MCITNSIFIVSHLLTCWTGQLGISATGVFRGIVEDTPMIPLSNERSVYLQAVLPVGKDNPYMLIPYLFQGLPMHEYGAISNN
jgi:hypothetical protein